MRRRLGAGQLGEQLDQPLADRLRAADLAGLDLGLEPADHLGGGRHADVGEDQRLLEALPGLVVDLVEEARRELGAQRLAALGEPLAQAREAARLRSGSADRGGSAAGPPRSGSAPPTPSRRGG